ncbi:MAG: isopeptide-forming domain-containing fimbrial protein, partial [Clostridiales bacterium]|nr:isopeptide-forming domain-containing fimbrial protein [Clostridiales bacterium]
KNTAVASGSAYTRFILLVVGDVSATPKRDVPTLEKHVVDTNDTNDTEGTSTDFQDSADHDIGDYIYYELVGTIIDDTTEYAAYDTYKMVFNDTLSKGLDFKNTTEYPLTVVAEVDGTKQTIPATITYNQESKTNYTIAGPTDITDPTDDYYEGESFTVTFDDVKTLYYYTDPDDPDTATALTVTAGSTITVHYYAYLNSDAVIGSAGNPNVAYLEYSNNPNSGGGGDLGETPKDKNIVFTYELDVTKVISGTSTGLNGAGFTLFKKVSSAPTLSTYSETFDGTYGGTAPTNVTKYYAKDASDTIYYVDATDSVYYKMIKTITLDSAYEFAFTGIDDGTYLLVETKTPSGYNTIDPVPFTVTATHTNDNDPTALALTDLTVTDGNSSNPLNGTATTSTGKIAASIGNAAGAVMPSTGGMGTKIFYTLGGILVVCAGVLLIVKRRMRNS